MVLAAQRRRARTAFRLGRAAVRRQHLRAWPWQERGLVRRLSGRMPTATLNDGPLVSIIVIGRDSGPVPLRLRDALERTSYERVEVVRVAAPSNARAGAIAAAVGGVGGELVCLFDAAAEPLRPDWLGHLVESVLAGAVAAGPLIVRARGRGLVGTTQGQRDLSLLSGGIDFARTWGVALPQHLGVGDDPIASAGQVVQVPAVSAACLLARRADLVAAGIPDGYAYDGIESGLAAAPLFDADLCLRLRRAGGTILRDGRAAVGYRVDLASPAPVPLPAPSRSEPPPDPDRAAFLDRWGPRLAREVLLDVVEGRHLWSARALTIATAGDLAGLLPGGTPPGLDWRMRSVSAAAVAPIDGRAAALSGDRDPALRDADVLVIDDPAADVRGTPTGLIRVAWVAHADRVPADLPEFDLVIAATAALAEQIGPAAGKPVLIGDLGGPAAGDTLRLALLDWIRARRLAVRIGASNWPNVRTWGDYHFGRTLQRWLELAGHPTRVRLLRDWTSDAAARDDATIHVFGKLAADNRTAQVNVLWQISHPDLASAELYDRYDLAFVASDPFAERMSGIARGPVVALHQATDPERFHPDSSGPRHELLYVANHRDDRPVIDWLLPTEHDLAVYGRGWTEHGLDARHHRGEHIANDELHRSYASAAVVLNDTWADMRAAGFIPNRIYDALASGAFVLSDDIVGLEREFDGAVVAYHDRTELRSAVERYLADPAARRELAERGRAVVLARHTFAQRARTIIEAIAPRLAERPPGIVEDGP